MFIWYIQNCIRKTGAIGKKVTAGKQLKFTVLRLVQNSGGVPVYALIRFHQSTNMGIGTGWYVASLSEWASCKYRIRGTHIMKKAMRTDAVVMTRGFLGGSPTPRDCCSTLEKACNFKDQSPSQTVPL